jgi:hypothetical protein
MTLDDLFSLAPLAPQDQLQELDGLRAAANESIADIQRLVKRHVVDDARIMFPRGYLREIGVWRTRLGFVRSNAVMNNVAYTLMMHDAQGWLLKRTDLGGTARDMIAKAAIASLAAVAEALLTDATTPPLGKRQSMASRIAVLMKAMALPPQLADDLKWLWDVRNRQHLFELTSSEFSFYSPEDQPRAESAVARLLEAFSARPPRLLRIVWPDPEVCSPTAAV